MREKQYKKRICRNQLPAALNTLKTHLKKNPGDLEAFFEKAQVECRLGMYSYSVRDYDRMLKIDNKHLLAAQAKKDTELMLRDQSGIFFKSFISKGRDSVAAMESKSFGYFFKTLVSNSSYLSAGIEKKLLTDSLEYESFRYRRMYLSYDERLSAYVSLYANVGKSFINKGLGRLSDNDFRIKIDTDHPMDMEISRKTKGVYENRFSLIKKTKSKTDTYRLNWRPHMKLGFYFDNERISYSDNNVRRCYGYGVKYRIKEHPSQVALCFDEHFYDSENMNIFVKSLGKITDIIYPYWTPEDHIIRKYSIRWDRDLEKDLICTGNNDRLFARLSFESETDGNDGIGIYAGCNIGVGSQSTLNLEIGYLNSEDWDSKEFSIAFEKKF